MEQIQKITHMIQLDKIDNIEFFKSMQPSLKGVKPSTVLFLAIIIIAVGSFFLNVTGIVIAFFCYLVPAYLSFNALESREKEDDVRLLTYWVIFSCSELTSPLIRLLFPRWLDMIIRVAITFALLHPSTNGAVKIYEGIIRPLLKKYEPTIDQQIASTLQSGKEKIINGVTEGLKKLN